MGEEVREDESALTSRKALLLENGSARLDPHVVGQ